MATSGSQNSEIVGVRDEMTEALEAGIARATDFYASGQNTLIDQISQDDWDGWDAGSERALVSDPDGLILDDRSERELAA